MTLAMKLKKLRLLRKMSTTELSKVSGVHQTTISALENNKHASPGIDTVERLAKALRVSPLYFFEDRVRTPFDLVNDLPSEISEFLLREESLPYLMLSKRAFENGISSVTIEQLLKVLQDTYNIKTTGEDDSSGERKKKEKKTGSST